MSGSPRHRMHAATTAALALVAGLLIFVWPVVSVAQPIDIPPDTLPPKQTPPPVAPERPGEDDAAAGARANRILNAIAEAHNADEWRRHRGIQADIHVNLGNEERLSGTLIYDYLDNRMRLVQPSGVIVVFDGEDAWSIPAGHADHQTVHRLQAYAFCLGAPFMLNDPKATRTAMDQMLIRGRMCDMVRLTFPASGEDAVEKEEVGEKDTETSGDNNEEPFTGRPDWLIALADERSHRLLGLAYAPPVVPLHLPDGADGPRLLLYEGHREINGALLSTRWQFFNWSDEWGVKGQPLGWARLTELTFVEPVDEWFEPPADDDEKAGEEDE